MRSIFRHDNQIKKFPKQTIQRKNLESAEKFDKKMFEREILRKKLKNVEEKTVASKKKFGRKSFVKHKKNWEKNFIKTFTSKNRKK